jgi:hypothetical protein
LPLRGPRLIAQIGGDSRQLIATEQIARPLLGSEALL